jgi:hypothetical protein
MDESKLTLRSRELLSGGTPRGQRAAIDMLAPTRVTWWVLVCGALLACVALNPLPASAASRSVASGNSGWIRFAHFVPSAGPVKVKVDGNVIATDLSFRGVTGYAMVSAGVHTVTVTSSSARAGATPLVIGRAVVPNGGAITVAAVASIGVKSSAHGSVAGGFALQVFPDDLSVPAPDHANVRVIHTVPGAPRVNALLTAATLSSNQSLVLGPVGYGQASQYVSVVSGTYQVEVKALNGETVAVGHNWPVHAGSVISIVVVETPSGPSLEVLSDAASAASDPKGGMQTGFGGTSARASLGSTAILPVGLALLFFITLAGLLRFRRPISFSGSRSLALRGTKRPHQQS